MLKTFLAGVLTIFSPCIIPLIPILLSSALASSTSSILWMTAGFLSSFTIIGIFITLIKSYITLDPEWIRIFGACFMFTMALAMIFPFLAIPFEKIGIHLERFGKQKSPDRLKKSSFFIGITMILIWAPCVGPSLGFALGWIVATETFAKGTLYLCFFGIGATLSLLILALLTKKLGRKWFHSQTSRLKLFYRISSITMLIVSILVLTQTDKKIESWATDILPDWWLNILTRY